MAAPPKAAHPGRTLVAFLVMLLALTGLMFLVDRSPTPRLGLDLQGGTSITLTAATSDGGEVTSEALRTAVEIIRSRVNSTGVAESDVTTQGANTIVVAVPGVGEDELVELVGTTAELRFRQVCAIAPGAALPVQTSTATPSGSATPDPSGTPTTGSATPSSPSDPAPSGTSSGSTIGPIPTDIPPTDTPAAFGRFGSSAGSLHAASLRAATIVATTPAQTTPAQTTPAQTTPAETTPAQTTPAETTPAETTPGETTPGETTTPAATTPPPLDPNALPGCESVTADGEVQQAFTDLECSDPDNRQGGVDRPETPVASCDADGGLKYLLAPATVLGTDVADASAGIPQNGVAWQVNLEFTGDGADRFTRMSEVLAVLPEAQIGSFPQPTNQFGIVLDGVVQSAPRMLERIPGNTAQITGDFTQTEAQQLANVLKYGALPLAFTTSDVSEVTPTLGSDYLRAGLVAGMIGLALVLVYAMAYYRALGLVIVASLAIAAAMTYLLVVLLGEWIGFTLTLAGVAGLIVAIGITADSFIVYFERIRDEIREGRTLRAAVEHGWVRARRTIISADFVSLLSAVVLYIVSIGNVRGFAFALGLSTVIDLVIVFLFTKPLMSWLVGTGMFAEGSRWSRLAGERMGTPVRRSDTRTRRTPGATIAEET